MNLDVGLRRMNFGKSSWLNQIVDIPVSQNEKELVKVNQLIPQQRIQQHASGSRPSLRETVFRTFTLRKSECFRHEA